MNSSSPRPIVLCILDGWGYRQETDNNAIALAKTPAYDGLCAKGPLAFLRTSADDVGLPAGQMGNSEVGHQNLGAGRVVLQDLPRIDKAVADGTLGERKVMRDLIAALKANGGACHLMGLLSPGGVHAHQSQLAALARTVAEAGVPVRVHGFLDGRDTPPRSAIDYVRQFIGDVDGAGDIEMATLSGRYYAMDRDKRWDRVAQAYATLVDAAGDRADAGVAAIEASYANDVSDEFLLPTAIGAYAGMADGDGLLMGNFRADRAREILTALLDPAFDGFSRSRTVSFAAQAGLVSYSSALDELLPALFPPESLRNTLGEVVANAGLTQLRIAETEKYAHVTFFLNGGEERTFEGEERILVPSPKVATYDLQPEMSAPEVTDRLVEAIGSGRFDLIVVNYANPDMVGHTGDLNAAIAAVETIDSCLGRLSGAIETAGGTMLVTADHGNVEMMQDPSTGQAHTAHTTNIVPALLINAQTSISLKDGRLADVAPTLLDLLQLPQPAEMTGHSLIDRQAAVASEVQERRETA